MIIDPDTKPVHPWAMYNSEYHILIAQITKTGSSTWRAIPGINFTNKWEHIDIEQRDIRKTTKLVIILRDPHERFISAANMMFRSNKAQLWKLWHADDYLNRDIHFRNQADFVANYKEFTNIDYWFYNKNICEEVNNHYNLGIDNVMWYRRNERTEDIFRVMNQEWIEEKYRRDYDLIARTKFINT